MNGVRKGSPIGDREVCFLCCHLQGSSLKDTGTSCQRLWIGNIFSMNGLHVVP